MDFWDRMRTTIDKGVDNSRDFLSRAQDKAKDVSERGVLRFEIMQLQSQAEKLTAKLGSRTYEVLVKEGQNTISRNTPGVKELLAEIEDVEQRAHTKEEQLAALGRQPPTPEEYERAQSSEDGSEADSR